MNRINVAKPWLGDDEVAAVTATLMSGWVAQGPRVAEFEKLFAARVGAEHAVALSSCTAALHLALIVADVGHGDEVVVPSFSFVATTNGALYVGATPVYADVDAMTGNLTVETIRPVLTQATKAVVLVHQGGIPADVHAIRSLCEPRGILVIEDAACAVGSTYRGTSVGSDAKLAAWSFHPRKLITTGEGGMLTTDSLEFATRARRLREHAMSVSATDRHRSAMPPAEEYLELGFNYRMTDVQAAIGIVQLGRLDRIVARRREIAAQYRASLSPISGLRLVADPPWGTTNYQSLWVEVLPEFSTTRDGLLAHLADRGISARRGIMAAHRQPAHAGIRHGPLPVTERLTDHTLILPVFHEMTSGELEHVLHTIRDAPHVAA